VSEYQYYEFLALDEPLGEREQRELRAISSRATISSTRFANFYTFGDLKADPARLVERYFDAHIYLANSGTRALTFRFPKRLLDLEIGRKYCRGGAAVARAKGAHVIVDFCSQSEPSDWTEDEEGPGHAASLLPVRALIAGGDDRALYLGWLLSASSGDLAEDAKEPPCPPGLRALSAPLQAMVDFLHIDQDIVDAAAVGSAVERGEGRSEIDRWVGSLPEADRSDLLVRFLEGSDPHLHAEAIRRVRASVAPGATKADDATRTVGQLLAEADRRREARRRAVTERAARERARRDRAAVAARNRELDVLALREEEAWAEVKAHVATTDPKRYDQAAKVLRDLRDLGLRRGDAAAIELQIELLCATHGKKPSFVRRVRAALAKEEPS
jgi:hypothetical protein